MLVAVLGVGLGEGTFYNNILATGDVALRLFVTGVTKEGSHNQRSGLQTVLNRITVLYVLCLVETKMYSEVEM